MKSRRLNESRAWSCLHREYSLDVDSRAVTCSKCETTLDAFDVLLGLSRQEGYHQMMDKERKKSAQQLAFLKGEERKVKARLKTANRKDADAAVAAERKRWEEKTGRAAWATREAKRAVDRLARLLEVEGREPEPTTQKDPTQ